MSPIFIVGAPRSGTTLLASLLNAHPRIAIPPEEDFILALFRRFGRLRQFDSATVEQFVDALYQSNTFHFLNLPRESLLARLQSRQYANYAEITAEVYRAYGESISPTKTRWGAKEPPYINYLKMLHGLYPDLKVVHIIRDGRDVLLSMRDWEKRNAGVKEFATGVTMAALRWKANVQNGRAAAHWLGNERYCEVRYEKLVSDPSSAIAGICSFVGEEFQPSMISSYYDNVVDNKLLRLDNLNNYLKKEISTGHIQRWSQNMPDHEIRRYESIAGRLLKDCGYELRHEKLPVVSAVGGFTCNLLYGAWRTARRALLPVG